MSEHDQPMSDQPTSVYDDPDLEWEYGDGASDEDAPPPRPRRKLLTPVSGGLAAIVLVAAGFIGGVQVQKHQGGSGGGGGASGARGAFAARLGAAGAGGVAATPGSGQGQAAGGGATGRSGAAGSSATVGTVANVKGSTLYVTGTDGTTVKVKTDDNSKVTRNAGAGVASVHPGDTVIVQGAKATSGTVTASSITATAKGVSAFVGLGGGAASGGSGASGVPQGFAPPAG